MTADDGASLAIGTGAETVRVGGAFVARVRDRAGDALLVVGSPNVCIGGPSGSGVSAGMIDACAAMEKGRDPPVGLRKANGELAVRNTHRQSYNNCGLESIRQIIWRATKNPVTEDQLLDHTLTRYTSRAAYLTNGLGAFYAATLGESTAPEDRHSAGGTLPPIQTAVLSDYDVPAHTVVQTPEALQQAVEGGHGVIASVWAGTLWSSVDKYADGTAGHAVVVTGIVRDDAGNVVAYIINDTGKVNDTGTGTCGQSVPAALFERSLMSLGVVTDRPLI